MTRPDNNRTPKNARATSGAVFTTPSRARHLLLSVRENSCKKSHSVVTISVLPLFDHASGDRPIESLAIESCATNFDSTMLKSLMLKRDPKISL